MPPPRHRDRGFSRRISNGLFFGYVAATIGIVVALGLVLVARFDPIAFQGIRGLALDLTAPFSSATRDVALGVGDVAGRAGSYWQAGSENAALRAELATARRDLIGSRIAMAENARLKGILRLVEQGAHPIASARIVGSSLTGQRRYATMTAGRTQGVRAGQPVRSADGLIGRVAETGFGWSRVELLSDGASSVPVRVLRTGQAALVAGRGDPMLEVRAPQAGPQPFRRGDLLVTSGTGGVFPAGIPVAVVMSVNGEIAAARPLADPARLDLAIVLPEVTNAPPPPVGGR
jgi:rod shape-determining protein MreC